MLAAACKLLSAPAHAQKSGVGGTGVDEASQLPICDNPLGTGALVEEKAQPNPRLAALPTKFRDVMETPQAQQGCGTPVDPLLQDRASGEIRFSSNSTIAPTELGKIAIATGLRRRAGILRFDVSAQIPPTNASMAAAVTLILASTSMNNQPEGDGKWQG